MTRHVSDDQQARRATRAEFATRAFIVLLLVLLVGAVVTILQIRHTQVDNTAKNDQQTQILRRVKSCTTPGQPCYERGRKQTAKAVGDINQVIIYAAACASGSSERTVAEIQACVIARLAQHSDR